MSLANSSWYILATFSAPTSSPPPIFRAKFCANKAAEVVLLVALPSGEFLFPFPSVSPSDPSPPPSVPEGDPGVSTSLLASRSWKKGAGGLEGAGSSRVGANIDLWASLSICWTRSSAAGSSPFPKAPPRSRLPLPSLSLGTRVLSVGCRGHRRPRRASPVGVPPLFRELVPCLGLESNSETVP